jgi:hypothetical protein
VDLWPGEPEPRRHQVRTAQPGPHRP